LSPSSLFELLYYSPTHIRRHRITKAQGHRDRDGMKVIE